MGMSHELGEDPEIWSILFEKSGSEISDAIVRTGLVSPFSLFLAVTTANIFSVCKVFSHIYLTDPHNDPVNISFGTVPILQIGKMRVRDTGTCQNSSLSTRALGPHCMKQSWRENWAIGLQIWCLFTILRWENKITKQNKTETNIKPLMASRVSFPPRISSARKGISANINTRMNMQHRAVEPPPVLGRLPYLCTCPAGAKGALPELSGPSTTGHRRSRATCKTLSSPWLLTGQAVREGETGRAKR